MVPTATIGTDVRWLADQRTLPALASLKGLARDPVRVGVGDQSMGRGEGPARVVAVPPAARAAGERGTHAPQAVETGAQKGVQVQLGIL